jgi:AhpD family alkylhydroperoxidase
MIACYVAALNRCEHCQVTHTQALHSLGGAYSEVAAALRAWDLDAAPITPSERLLLEFVGVLTRHAYQITDEQVQGLRHAGWSDAQLAETVYIGALTNMLVRVADAFGVQPPSTLDADAAPTAAAKERDSGTE